MGVIPVGLIQPRPTSASAGSALGTKPRATIGETHPNPTRTTSRDPPMGGADAVHSIRKRDQDSMADDISFNPSREDFAALLDESFGGRDFHEGTVVQGKVVAVEKDFAIIDVGLKT